MHATGVHDEVQTLLAAAALGALDEADRQRLIEHVRECTACAMELDGYREVVGALAAAAPPQTLDVERSAALRARLVARAQGAVPAGEGTSAAESRPAAVRRLGIGAWLGWAVAASLAGVLLVHHGVHGPLDRGWLVAGVLAIALGALGVYLLVQRARMAALRERLTALERAGR